MTTLTQTEQSKLATCATTISQTARRLHKDCHENASHELAHIARQLDDFLEEYEDDLPAPQDRDPPGS